MKYLNKIKALVFAIIMSATIVLPMTLTAQRNDGFFRGRYDDDTNRDDHSGITIEGMHNENPAAPLGSGLLIMVTAGAGYAVVRRKRAMRNGITLLLAFAFLLGMTQCKKKIVSTAETSNIHIYMTASASNGNRTEFVPNMGDGTSGFNWNSTGNEYVVVSGNSTGYLGELYAVAPGGDAALNRTEFGGTILAPSDDDTKLYFFYLGNGSHSQAEGTASTVIDFSNQGDGTTSSVTNYLIAAEEIARDKVVFDGSQCHVTIDLRVKTAIAFFRLSGFTNAANQNETVYLHGSDVFTSAEINFKTGEVIGKDRGYINVGTNNVDGVYVSLIDSGTTTAATLQFDSNSKNGSIVFPNGIKGRMFYSDQLEQEYTPLPINAAASLPEDVLPGLFSVAPGKMVRFSKGNLQCTRTSTSIPWAEGTGATWSFMEHQYSVAEPLTMVDKNDHIYDPLPENKRLYEFPDHPADDYYVLLDSTISVDYGNRNRIGLFSWGATGFYDVNNNADQEYIMPNITLPGVMWEPFEIYTNKFGPTGSNFLSVSGHSDWGYCMDYDENSKWRMLTFDEWVWLLGFNKPQPGKNCRVTSNSIAENARFTRAKIGNMHGIVIFPDNYTHPEGSTLLYINHNGDQDNNWENSCNDVNISLWSSMEEAGAVFLPAAGYRDYDEENPDYPVYTYRVGYVGYYWTNQPAGAYSARQFDFDGGFIATGSDYRTGGYSIRLVYDTN